MPGTLSPAEVRDRAESAVAGILATADDYAIWFLFEAVGHRIMNTDYPAVIVTRKGRVKCPHCGAKATPGDYHDPYCGPWRERDWSTSDNPVEVFADDDGAIGLAVSQDDEGRKTLAFVCQSCALPVSIPADLEVMWQ